MPVLLMKLLGTLFGGVGCVSWYKVTHHPWQTLTVATHAPGHWSHPIGLCTEPNTEQSLHLVKGMNSFKLMPENIISLVVGGSF